MSKQQPFIIEKRRAKIAEMYLAGVSCMVIAEQVGVTPRQVWYDLNAMRKNWRNSAMLNLHDITLSELDKIDRIEAEAWEGWYRSQEPKTRTTTRNLKVKYHRDKERAKTVPCVETIITKDTQMGNPAFLEKALNCVRLRAQLLNLVGGENLQPPLPMEPAQQPTLVQNNTYVTAEINHFNPQQLEAIEKLASILNPKRTIELQQ